MENQPVQNPNTEPVQPAGQTPAKSNRLLIVILSILLVVAVVVAGLFYFQIQRLSKELAQLQVQVQATPTPLPAEASAQEGAANWKTYTDTKFRFSLKYPNGWEFKPCTDMLCGTFLENNKEIIRLEGVSDACGLGNFTPTLEYAEKFSMCSCDASGPGINITCDSPSEEKVTTTPNGVVVYGFLLDELKNNIPEGKRGPYNTIFFSKPILSGGVLYEYGLYFEVLDSNKIPVFDQILSTFKFLGANDSLGQYCAGPNNLPCPASYACKLNVVGNVTSGGKCVNETETNP